jgi:hypothetical protein
VTKNEIEGAARAEPATALNVAAAALTTLAFALPLLPGGAHGSLSAEPPLAIAGVLLTLLVSQALMWLIVRHRSDSVKARARLFVSVAVLLMVGSNFVHAASTSFPGDGAFTKQAGTIKDKYGPAFEELGRRFRSGDISLALTAEGVTTREGLAKGRQLVETYRGLLDERKRLIGAQRDDIDKLFKMKSVSPDVRRAAEIVFLDGRERLDKMNTDLDYAQRGMADAMSDLLGWFEKEVGRVGVRNGKVIYFFAEQKAGVDPLFERLQYAEARQKAVLQAAAKEQALAEATDAVAPGRAASSSQAAGKGKPRSDAAKKG